MKKKNLFIKINIFLIAVLFLFFVLRLGRSFIKYREYTVADYLLENKVELKGDCDKNYLLYKDVLYRIVKINPDSSLLLIVEKPLKKLAYQEAAYSLSNIYTYFSTDLIRDFDTADLLPTAYYLDFVSDLNTLNERSMKHEDYLTLLDIEDYLNSIKDNTTYLADEMFWLGNTDGHKAYVNNGAGVSLSDPENSYPVRYVLTLKAKAYLSGKGSAEDPLVVK